MDEILYEGSATGFFQNGRFDRFLQERKDTLYIDWLVYDVMDGRHYVMDRYFQVEPHFHVIHYHYEAPSGWWANHTGRDRASCRVGVVRRTQDISEVEKIVRREAAKARPRRPTDHVLIF